MKKSLFIFFCLCFSFGMSVSESTAQTESPESQLGGPMLLFPEGTYGSTLLLPPFTWVDASPFIESRGPFAYRVTVKQLYPSQSPETAVLYNPVWHRSELIFRTSYIYPLQARPLTNHSGNFVWFVEIVDISGQIVYRVSEPVVFSFSRPFIRPVAALPEDAPVDILSCMLNPDCELHASKRAVSEEEDSVIRRGDELPTPNN
ncbi:MAG: hypothetical protein LAT84_08960 [Balneolia bacterium]|nr:hypothetical protein [Balneolia bacterium]